MTSTLSRLWRGLLANQMALLIALLTLGIGGIEAIQFNSAMQEDTEYRTLLQQQLANSMQQQRLALERQLSDYAIWDEASSRINRSEPDMVWIRSALTRSVYLNLRIDSALIVDPASRKVIFALQDGHEVADGQDPLALDDTAWRWLHSVLLQQARHPTSGYILTHAGGPLLQGDLSLLVAQPVLQENGPTVMNHRKVMIFARRVDRVLARQISFNSAISNAWIALRPSGQADILQQPVHGIDGRPLAWLSWQFHAPGRDMLHRLVPATTALCSLLLLLGWLLGRQANRLRGRQAATLQRLERQGQALRDIVEQSQSQHSGGLSALCRKLAETLEASRVVIWQHALDTHRLHRVAGSDSQTHLADEQITLMSDAARIERLDRLRFMAIREIDTRPLHESFVSYIRRYRLQSALIATIRVGHKMHGIISVEHQQPRRWHQDEINFICSAANAIALQTETGARQAAENELANLFYFDSQTGLPNQHRLLLHLDNLALTGKDRQGICCAIELSDLAQIIEGFDKATGAALTNEVARRLQNLIRVGEIAARLSDTRFAVWLEGQDDEELNARLSGLHQSIRAPYLLPPHALHPRFQLGVSFFPDDGPDAETLVQRAQAALQQTPGPSPQPWSRFDSHLNDQRKQSQQLRMELRQAMDKGQLSLHFQPLIDLRSGQVSGAEALLRWQHHEHGAISPALFIPLAEEDEVLICAIGKWVLDQACAHAARWRLSHAPTLRISVNVSARQMESPGFHQLVREILARHALPPSAIELELTESIAMSHTSEVETNLRELQALQVEMAIDDFGTGYASFSYLRRFPVNRLKVDRQFFESVPQDLQKSNLVKMIVAMGHAMGASVIGEGVEQAEQVRFLRAIGGDYAQGYYFSKPLPAAEMEAFLQHPDIGLP
ncbi:EAL domain-containing protein [Paludibacterium sp. B53371]|uniref:bifunctional diguanylate cyclase/phosphodiesterase n=1 Tax=Paludibacterium sp. B53371 TaxID=2806263 RepID=UPI001C04CE9B|nr:EAL domain-containing protein [Paludibacterium sp. B53371]